MPSPRSPSTFRTTDFYLTAFLVASGLPVIDTTREGRRCTFIFTFPDEETRKQTIFDYYQNTVTVAPHKFAQAIKTVKALIHDDN